MGEQPSCQVRHGPRTCRPVSACSTGSNLDGLKSCKVSWAAPSRANNFWVFRIDDNQGWSLLETDQKTAGVDSDEQVMKKNTDNSVTIGFGPRRQQRKRKTWARPCRAPVAYSLAPRRY